MEPKTRTETKKQGKKNGGPYSAKHVRRLESILAGEKKLPTTCSSGMGSPLPKDGKSNKKTNESLYRI
jgi:hypothetical protein